MAKLSILVGSTSQTVNVFIQDSSATTGAGLTGLVFNTSSLTCYYVLPKAASAAVTLATLAAATSAWSSGGFKEIDATNCPGLYRLDLPDAALASGRFVTVYLRGATNMAQTLLEIELTAVNNQDGVHGGMSALPNTACTTNASLLTSGTGSDQLSVTTGRIDIGKLLGTAWLTPGTAGTPDVNVKLWNALATVALPIVPTVAGRTLDVSAGGEAGVDWANVGTPSTSVNLSATTVNLTNTLTTYTGNTVQTGDAYARIGAAGVGLTAVGLTGTQTFNNTGTWTGNIVGTLSTLTTYTGNTPQTGDSYARIGAAGAGLTSVALTSAYDFAKGTVAVTESYSADGAAPTPVQALMLIQQCLTESSIATTTQTVKKLDGSTTAATLTLNSSTAPTSVTRAT